MTAPLTVHNAEIRTATVEIKSLTVSGKQVTQSVFRQLQESPLIAYDGTLNGTPWGTVNYHPDKCGDSRAEHWHVVWQDGTELRRSLTAKEPVFLQRWEFRLKEADRYYSADIRNLLAEGKGRHWYGGLFTAFGNPEDIDAQEKRLRDHGFIWKTHDLDPAVYWTEEAGRALEAELAARKARRAHEQVLDFGKEKHYDSVWCRCADCMQAKLTTAEETAQAALAQLEESCGTDLDELRDACYQALGAEVARRQRHRDVRQALADLPQLFIAV